MDSLDSIECVEVENNKVKRRSKNFTHSETYSLLALVKRYKNYLECKKNDSRTNKLKRLAWLRISTEFNNTQFNQYRSADTLRVKYENLKKAAKSGVLFKTEYQQKFTCTEEEFHDCGDGQNNESEMGEEPEENKSATLPNTTKPFLDHSLSSTLSASNLNLNLASSSHILTTQNNSSESDEWSDEMSGKVRNPMAGRPATEWIDMDRFESDEASQNRDGNTIFLPNEIKKEPADNNFDAGNEILNIPATIPTGSKDVLENITPERAVAAVEHKNKRAPQLFRQIAPKPKIADNFAATEKSCILTEHVQRLKHAEEMHVMALRHEEALHQEKLRIMRAEHQMKMEILQSQLNKKSFL